MVAEKNTKLKSHPELADVPNLHVMTVLKSLKSRGHVDETFTWRHAYYRLNNTGITYLRETLHLPAEVSILVYCGRFTESITCPFNKS